MNPFRWLTMFLAIFMTYSSTGEAQVRVVKSAASKTAIDLSGFTTENSQAAGIFRTVLQADLRRSGWFVTSGPGKGEVRVLGSCEERSGSLRVKCNVYSTVTQERLLGNAYRLSVAEVRALAHKVADDIVMAVTGRKGIASTKMIMLGTRTRSKELYLCDADGQGLKQLTRDNTVSVRPRWSPDASSILYTSYLKRFPDIYKIELSTGERNRIAGYPGLNTGGALSPDGRHLALILSKDGNPELYTKNMRTSGLTRLTTTGRAAEASPSWSPDGNQLVYVSDQSGRPQLYTLSRTGGRPQRLTSRGRENVAPDWGPGGMIAYSSKVGPSYQVMVIDPRSKVVKQVSEGRADYEDPSWAPDGRHVACSRTENYHSAVYILDTLGDPPIRLLNQSGDWYSPAWSPH